MACINMFNSDHQGGGGGLYGPPPPMSPRISFSNDFSLSPPSAATTNSPSAPSDPNFEFSVGSRPMMAADELFFKGRMLPLRGGGGRATTLRDELQAPEDGARTPRGSAIRWRELLGLRRTHKVDKESEGEGHAVKSPEELSSIAEV